MMRAVRYKKHGAVGGEVRGYGSLTQMLFDVPDLRMSLLTLKRIPPLHVLNEVLGSGISDAGMSGGCRWQPFLITEDEYAELVEDLLALPGADLSVDAELQSCRNLKDWNYKLWRKYGKEYRKARGLD
jgi:hypothetical protein